MNSSSLSDAAPLYLDAEAQVIHAIEANHDPLDQPDQPQSLTWSEIWETANAETNHLPSPERHRARQKRINQLCQQSDC